MWGGAGGGPRKEYISSRRICNAEGVMPIFVLPLMHCCDELHAETVAPCWLRKSHCGAVCCIGGAGRRVSTYFTPAVANTQPGTCYFTCSVVNLTSRPAGHMCLGFGVIPLLLRSRVVCRVAGRRRTVRAVGPWPPSRCQGCRSLGELGCGSA